MQTLQLDIIQFSLLLATLTGVIKVNSTAASLSNVNSQSIEKQASQSSSVLFLGIEAGKEARPQQRGAASNAQRPQVRLVSGYQVPKRYGDDWVHCQNDLPSCCADPAHEHAAQVECFTAIPVSTQGARATDATASGTRTTSLAAALTL